MKNKLHITINTIILKMGYDIGECVICYCISGCNGSSNTIPLNICHICFKEHCPDGLRGRACCSSYVGIAITTCDVCGMHGVTCLEQVAVCIGCAEEIKPDIDISKFQLYMSDSDSSSGSDDEDKHYKKYEKSQRVYDPSYRHKECDGTCGCVNCDAWKIRSCELFM